MVSICAAINPASAASLEDGNFLTNGIEWDFRQSLYHGGEHASQLLLPVMPRFASDAAK